MAAVPHAAPPIVSSGMADRQRPSANRRLSEWGAPTGTREGHPMQTKPFLGREFFNELTQCYTFSDGSGSIPVELEYAVDDAFMTPLRFPLEGNAVTVLSVIWEYKKGLQQ